MSEPQAGAASGSETLLWAYQLDGKGHGSLLPRGTQVPDSDSEGFCWFHCLCDAPDSVTLMRELTVSDNVIEALTANETRPHCIPIDGGLFIVLRAVNTNPGAEPEDMVSIRMWLNAKTVVSARRQRLPLRSVLDLRERIDQGGGPRTPGEFVTMLAERIADRITDVVNRVDDELTEVETHLEDEQASDVRRSLSDLRRRSAELRRYLAPQRDALDSLYRSRDVLTEQDALQLRYQTDRMTRCVEELDLARERTLVLQEELKHRVAEQQNSRMYVLSIVTAVFLPLSFLTGLFGMNVAGLPGIEDPTAFYDVAIGMAVLALALLGFMRWRNWL